jgi:hypothetical protein
VARLQQRLRDYLAAQQEAQRGGPAPSAQQVQQQQLAGALAEAARQQQAADQLTVGGRCRQACELVGAAHCSQAALLLSVPAAV